MISSAHTCFESQKTAWVYDAEGRMTRKTNQANVLVQTNGYNANGQLTARWTAQKGLTAYTYDGMRNLTFVNYPVGTTDITYQYNVLSRLTNMIDAAGTTKFTYNTAGGLATEDGRMLERKKAHKYFHYRVEENGRLHWERKQEVFTEEEGLDGWYLLDTNASADQAAKKAVLAHYKGLLNIEEAFAELELQGFYSRFQEVRLTKAVPRSTAPGPLDYS